MEVYTGYGDKGMTDLSHTKNVSKSDDRICLMGSVEELMSHIGLVRVLIDDVDVVRMLEKISETLKKIIDGVSDPYNREFKVSEDRTELLEEKIGRMKEIFSGRGFRFFSGIPECREIDVTRAVARRAERELALVSVKFGSDTGAKKYMNRLSDYFYVLARYVDVARLKQKKTDISGSVQKSVKAETAGIEANVGVEAVGTVGSSADVAAGTSAVDVRAQDSQMVQKRDVQAFDVQNGTVTTAVGGNTAMAQNDSISSKHGDDPGSAEAYGYPGSYHIGFCQEAYREDRAGSFEKKQAFCNCGMQPGWKSGCGSCDGWIFSCKLLRWL